MRLFKYTRFPSRKKDKNGVFETLSKEEYLDIVTDIIERLPNNMVIHRLTGDGPKKILVSPLWSANKKDVLNSLNKLMKEKKVLFDYQERSALTNEAKIFVID